MESKHKRFNKSSEKLDLRTENSGIRVIPLCIEGCMALLISVSLEPGSVLLSLFLCLQILLMAGHSDLAFLHHSQHLCQPSLSQNQF